MTHNRAIAERFAQMADMLEIKGESIFRINAYRRAARAVEGLTEDVAALAARGELTNIPGIGKATAEKIVEFLRTGTMKAYDELAATLPPGLTTLMAVPEVGPKTALLLYEQLGITSLDALEAAAKAGRLRDLPRMGPKTEENILRGIAMVRRSAARRPLGVALPVAEALVATLRETREVDAIEVAGSLRRRKETVGDIDILVTSRSPERVMEAFVAAPPVAQVLSHGPTRSSVILDVGLQADVRVVEPASYGAALQYFTGSKEHNVALRERAVRRGLKLNEYGVWRTKDDRRIAGRDEAGVYNAVGLPWIPPELREDAGELEAAEAGRLPTLVTVEEIRGDLHVHTTWSDGASSAEAMATAAKALGYAYLCITDHSQSLKVAGGVSVEDLRAHAAVVRRLSDRLGIEVLMGTECDIGPDGALDYPDEVLDDLDVVIASVHTRFRMSRDEMTRRIVRALETGRVDILGHPTGRLLGARDPYEVDIERIVDAAARSGVALEINASPERLDLKDTDARLARERGVRLAVNTDAHAAAELRHMPLGISVARRAWAEAADVLNTLSPTALRAHLRGRRGARRRR
ncbi:MAG: DNA polymerase/3'-5' exonuclease PolX [Armatimonadota bacterium]|nr:DNA polymerase/3'-5' exonuclease PolX [Armatimonadota bacterium]MDR7421354.1 DNA polymerase/3'-5' exonuclease PolX [Armatimonadota bacterium]MDR7455257.1 DNA polymerase/3'-5' exonuclease PolX [Armatimonadota bacterium]MDR7456496.1 DNA polymerase/3'-5' exonuclease PolX [Armatimonadota bacterium]MDR7496237.1 DNA polymerase/3'-5' exonuclease PolX [Armatimonadota bacterium]